MKVIKKSMPRLEERLTKMILLPLQYFSDFNLNLYSWMYSYHVNTEDKPEAKGLSEELYDLFSKGALVSDLACQKVIQDLYKLRVPSWEELEGNEVWDQVASGMPEDIGGIHKQTITYLLSSLTRGTTLESMCGFNSYILPQVDRPTIAMDYSERMLMKYPYPERMRIQFDLNRLPNEHIEFPDSYFESIVFVKGYKYLQNPFNVFQEYHRLLQTGGTLQFIESKHAMYSDLAVRNICPYTTKTEVEKSGFVYCEVQCLPFRESEDDMYYLFKAQKN